MGENQIHRLRGEDSLQVAVQNAEAEMRRTAPAYEKRQPLLDLILLGLGENGHVARLFAGAIQKMDISVPFLAVGAG
jgi:6-phosphogluconolactonase/glucosamine-6-phosphate isomerase/deaminase